mmetsp:Transcript_19522/g.21560  ORF Transcript_19522/g.21560 Transcript_19522/m.21560 type:complete len:216 (-) Transcript_19522:1169-1816(-)
MRCRRWTQKFGGRRKGRFMSSVDDRRPRYFADIDCRFRLFARDRDDLRGCGGSRRRIAINTHTFLFIKLAFRVVFFFFLGGGWFLHGGWCDFFASPMRYHRNIQHPVLVFRPGFFGGSFFFRFGIAAMRCHRNIRTTIGIRKFRQRHSLTLVSGGVSGTVFFFPTRKTMIAILGACIIAHVFGNIMGTVTNEDFGPKIRQDVDFFWCCFVITFIH